MADKKAGVDGGGEVFAEPGLEGRPEVFNGIEIRRVGRQEEQLAARRRRQRGGGRRLMETGVVQHDHAACGQHWQQRVFKIRVHHPGITSPRKGQRGDQFALLAGGDDTRPFAPLPRHGFINPFPPWGATVGPMQPVIHAALVEVIHSGGGQLFQFAPVKPPLDFVALAIFQEFFLACSPAAGAAPRPRCG